MAAAAKSLPHLYCCSLCRRWLPADQYIWSRKTSKRASRCRECNKAYSKQWRSKNPGYYERWIRTIRSPFNRYGPPRNHAGYGYGSINIEEMRAETPYREMMAMCEQWEQANMARKRFT